MIMHTVTLSNGLTSHLMFPLIFSNTKNNTKGKVKKESERVGRKSKFRDGKNNWVYLYHTLRCITLQGTNALTRRGQYIEWVTGGLMW